MKEYFIYDDKVYESEDDVNEAIIEKIGHNYNNIDVAQTGEFELEAQTIETVTFDEDTEDNFVFVRRHKDYVIFKNKQDGKYYWQAEYDGDDRKLGNFNVWIKTRGIRLYSEDDEGYSTKTDAVSKAKEWIDKQKRKMGLGDLYTKHKVIK